MSWIISLVIAIAAFFLAQKFLGKKVNIIILIIGTIIFYWLIWWVIGLIR